MTMTTLQLRRRTLGQALPAAVMVLSVLLVLGLVFLGIVSRNINQGAQSRTRNRSQDLAESGVRFMHTQTRYSAARADWRPALTQPIAVTGDTTRDPDIRYLRPASLFPWRPGQQQLDIGGPDGLGPFSRMDSTSGRSLIRIRYATSDANLFDTDPVGPARSPGLVRSYVIFESVGRPGRINPNDPTTFPDSGNVQFRNYASAAAFYAARDAIATRDGKILTSRKLIAYATIGLIDHALFITDKDNVSNPADLGADPQSGARFGVTPVQPIMRIGSFVDGPTGNVYAGGGSIFSNADLRFFGNVEVVLNRDLGDKISIAGSTIGATDTSQLRIFEKRGDETSVVGDRDIILTNTGGTINAVATTDTLDSGKPNFRTIDGNIRDGARVNDVDGQPRYLGRVEPPSTTELDPANNQNSYVTSTRQSGRIGTRGNSGQYGHGRNVFVNNTADRQAPADESGREGAGGEQSILHDIMNPENRLATTGWQGNFYVPVGAYVRLAPTGFSITRDGRAPGNQRTWRDANGVDTGRTSLNYRLGGDPDGMGPEPAYLINEITNPADFNAANPVWTNGFPFDGVLYFEGNVRVRGVIPTDQQLTIVSGATIYIEGSITRGVTDAVGARLNRPSRSAIALLAKDNVIVNTTQFFGLNGGQALNASDQDIRMSAAAGSMSFVYEFPWRTETVTGLPAVNSYNPTTYRPATIDYLEAGTTNPIFPSFMLSHTGFGAAQFSFLEAEVNRGAGTSTYFFPADALNLATPFFPPAATIPAYGLGPSTAFETRAFPLVRDNYGWANTTLTGNNQEGVFQQYVGGFLNEMTLRSTNVGQGSTNDYLLRRAAITPHDVKIEAAIYAEEGSFLVIPGRMFNSNSDDRRDTFAALGATLAARNQQRYNLYGSLPETPFYAEPLDVRITILGAVSQNMPAPVSFQTETLKRWGWIPSEIGSTGRRIPTAHVPTGYDVTAGDLYVPNLTLIYDPVLATGRVRGFQQATDSYVRFDRVQPDPVNAPAVTVDYPLPPMPRLPVSPTLAYFGEVNP